MNIPNLSKVLRRIRPVTGLILSLSGTSGLLHAQSTASGETVKMEKFIVTGSFIPVATSEPIGPVAVFSEADIRSTGAFTPIQALRSLPSFIGNPGPTENDSNGGSGATFVSLRGLGANQTLVLLNGRATNQFSNIQLLPIEAIDRVEVLRDGAGIIYGSAAIGGAVNVILKKTYTGSVLNIQAGGATRSPGGRETFQASFVAGAATGGTSLMVSGSYFKNRTIYASQRPNSSFSDARLLGGLNGGSPTFPGHIAINAGGTPSELRTNFPATGATPTLADYGPFDTNGFSSSQLFNFRQFSPSTPGQIRNSLLVDFEQKLFNSVSLFSSFLYSRLATFNGLAPAPFALQADPVNGTSIGDVTTFGPYNQGILSNVPNTDFFRYRSIELGNRTGQQTFTDYRMQVGLKGAINDNWTWETTMSLENEEYEQVDSGVPSLPLLDIEIQAGRFNPFAPGFSTGSAVIGGRTFTWDNATALRAAEIHARQVSPTKNRFWDARVNGTLLELPAGDLGFAAGWELIKSTSVFDPDPLYASGSVLGLNALFSSHNGGSSRSVFAEIKAPIISEKSKVPFIENLTLGALARRETQTVSGPNPALARGDDSRSYQKVNPSVNFKYSPTKDFLVRGSWSKGFLAPLASRVFGTPGQSNPTLQDPLGFAVTPQTTVVIRTNPSLVPAVSKAISLGVVGSPRNFIKGLSFSIDYYNISVDGIVAGNYAAILAANAAGQGPGFVFGNAATINPNAPFANLIVRRANGQLNSGGNLGLGGVRGAVLSDFTNIASRKLQGMEYTVSYVYDTQDWGRFRFQAAANQFLKFEQSLGPGVPVQNYLGKFVSTVGDPISPGSIPRWKGNIGNSWNYKSFTSNVTLNYVGPYQDDPLFVLHPNLYAFYQAGTATTANPAFVAYLAAGALVNPRVGGVRTISAFTTLDLQTTYAFTGDSQYTKGLSLTLGATNLFDKLAPIAFGAFNDNYDTRTHNNVGRFVYTSVRKTF